MEAARAHRLDMVGIADGDQTTGALNQDSARWHPGAACRERSGRKYVERSPDLGGHRYQRLVRCRRRTVDAGPCFSSPQQAFSR